MPISGNKPEPLDAGLKSVHHYLQRLPKWRYQFRLKVLPVVRWETPYLAWLQGKLRTPLLDSWFALTANLGTHTFYMLMLPVIFWCGYVGFGRGLVRVLAAGVFFSGFIKDMLCLPRPLSPPLTRISMSRSAALEYGFPSTHSANAISVVIYGLAHIRNSDMDPTISLVLHTVLYLYGGSIVMGRLYCGMHGFFDVYMGSFLGALLAYAQLNWGSALDAYVHGGSFKDTLILTIIILVLIRIHPEPADSCPCFDDSVAFAGVFIGQEIGLRLFANTSLASNDPIPANIPFDFEKVGPVKTVARIIVGVFLVVVWRSVMKPSLHHILPPLFRISESVGISLPRRFFMKASQYTKVPKHLKDDNVLPDVSDMPSMLKSLRHPRQRSISVGPQSEADAYETIAYREKRRRGSIGSLNHASQSPAGTKAASTTSARWGGNAESPLAPPGASVSQIPNGQTEEQIFSESEEGDQEVFAQITPPRVRYDVEVVTKLVVYTGISIIALMLCPFLFSVFGWAP